MFKSKRVWQKHVESDLQQLTSGAVSSAFILYVFFHLVLTLRLSVVLICCPNIKSRIQSNIIPPKNDVIYHTTEIFRGMRDSGESLSFCNTLRKNILKVSEIAKVTSAKSVLHTESSRNIYSLLKALSCMNK